jgi:NTP pyrophosphatase (non-canonical NTP hydrolase)/DNA-binding XRE family transcriptional regulator
MLKRFNDNVHKLFNKPAIENGARYHALLGLTGELGELADCLKKHYCYGLRLDGANLVEELGDLTFYATAMLHTIGLDLNIKACVPIVKSLDSNMPEHLRLLRQITIMQQSLVKLEFVTNGYQPSTYINEIVALQIHNVMASVISIAKVHYIGINTILTHNMNKLAKRYPNKEFSKQHCVERLDKAANTTDSVKVFSTCNTLPEAPELVIKYPAHKEGRKLYPEMVEEVKDKVEQDHWTREELAEAFGISAQSISYIMQGVLQGERRAYTHYTPEIVNAVQSYYNLGHTVKQTYEHFDYPLSSVRKIINGEYDHLFDV